MNTLTALRPAAQPAPQTDILGRILSPATAAPAAANDSGASRLSLLVRRRERQTRRDMR